MKQQPMDEIKAKQQIVEKIKEAGKILVTVSDNPSVDALSAALALTLIFDKQEKYATAVFSGETPPAIAFLEPEKTFDDTTDSLRDFIIALNKEKADHLRYKIEGEAVKIFITPYKTTIDQSDLDFSQGDYNVELVIAIGVDNQEHLDKALDNHGQILHDAAIITITAGEQTSSLGGIDWHDSNASSLSEMITGLAEALKEDKKKSLLDKPIATALLTGIVAQTDRFSNENTTSKVMTVAASLMAAGADQQLIANELQQAQNIEVRTPNEEDDTTDGDAGSTPSDTEQDSSEDELGMMTVKKDPTSLSISHDETLAELDERIRGEEAAHEKIEDEIEAVEEAAEEAALKREQEAIAASTPKIEPASVQPVEQPIVPELPTIPEAPAQPEPTQVQSFEPAPAPAYEPVVEPAPQPPVEQPVSEPQRPAEIENVADTTDAQEPTFGGTLNATTDQAEEDARKAIEDDKNRTILSHAYIGEESSPSGSSSSFDGPSGFPGTPPAAPGSMAVNDVNALQNNDSLHAAYALDENDFTHDDAPVPSESGPVGGERVIQPLSEQPATPVFNPSLPPADVAPVTDSAPTDFGLPLPPPVPDFSQGLADAIPAIPTVPPATPADVYAATPPADQPKILGDILAPEPPTSLGLDYETTNTNAAPGSAYAYEDTPPAPSSPGQYRIPGQ